MSIIETSPSIRLHHVALEGEGFIGNDVVGDRWAIELGRKSSRLGNPDVSSVDTVSQVTIRPHTTVGGPSILADVDIDEPTNMVMQCEWTTQNTIGINVAYFKLTSDLHRRVP